MESIMTKLPERNILDGSTLPKTTTGEMKGALGKIRDYLFELFGDDSADKEAARLSLGIDLDGLNGRLSGKAERTELEALQDEIGKRGVPIGSIDYFATTTPPTGYLKADGAAVGRETYPDLFAAIGTTFGEGDGSTTFNLPDLMGRFPEGHDLPGMVKEAGLPNVTGALGLNADRNTFNNTQTGAFYRESAGGKTWAAMDGTPNAIGDVKFDASRSNSIYGASDTVQPPALTLLPCIKAFDAVVNPGLIDVTELGNDLNVLADVAEKIVESTNTYIRYEGGWQICRGTVVIPAGSKHAIITLPCAFRGTDYSVVANYQDFQTGETVVVTSNAVSSTTIAILCARYNNTFEWTKTCSYIAVGCWK